jgi:hypothetical protein
MTIAEPENGSYASVSNAEYRSVRTFRRITERANPATGASWFRIPVHEHPDEGPLTWAELNALGVVGYVGTVHERP